MQGNRKLVVALSALVSACALKALGMIDDGSWMQATVSTVLGAYGANVLEHAASLVKALRGDK